MKAHGLSLMCVDELFSKAKGEKYACLICTVKDVLVLLLPVFLFLNEGKESKHLSG